MNREVKRLKVTWSSFCSSFLTTFSWWLIFFHIYIEYLNIPWDDNKFIFSFFLWGTKSTFTLSCRVTFCLTKIKPSFLLQHRISITNLYFSWYCRICIQLYTLDKSTIEDMRHSVSQLQNLNSLVPLHDTWILFWSPQLSEKCVIVETLRVRYWNFWCRMESCLS